MSKKQSKAKRRAKSKTRPKSKARLKSKTRLKSKALAKSETPEPSRLRICRDVASELMGGRSDAYFDRLEARGELTAVRDDGLTFYFIDDFRAILTPGSKLSLELAGLKRRALDGEILSIANNANSVMLDGSPLAFAD